MKKEEIEKVVKRIVNQYDLTDAENRAGEEALRQSIDKKTVPIFNKLCTDFSKLCELSPDILNKLANTKQAIQYAMFKAESQRLEKRPSYDCIRVIVEIMAFDFPQATASEIKQKAEEKINNMLGN